MGCKERKSALPTVTAQRMSILCLFVMFTWSPELLSNMEEGVAFPTLAVVTILGGAGFKEITTKSKKHTLSLVYLSS